MNEFEMLNAIKSGDEKRVSVLLEEHPELADARDENGVSAVLVAQYRGQAALARRIADAKGSIDLFEAAAIGDQHQLERALSADPLAIDALNADGFGALGLAAYFGHLEILQQLLRRGANPNVASENGLGVLPLHSALSAGHKQIAEALIKSGSDLNTPSKEGWTPLRYAIESNDVETSRILLDRGARPTASEVEIAKSADRTHLAQLLQTRISTALA